MNFGNKKVLAGFCGVLVVVLVAGYFGWMYIAPSAIDRQFPQFSGMAMDEVETIATTSEDDEAVLSARHYLGLLHLSGAYAGPEKIAGAEYASAENLKRAKKAGLFALNRAWDAADAKMAFITVPMDASGGMGAITAASQLASRGLREYWPKLTATLGDWVGLNPNIGKTYWAVVKTARDAESVVWVWQSAAETGYAESQYWLGQAYRYGYGVEADQAKAKELICAAAEKDEAAKFSCDKMKK